MTTYAHIVDGYTTDVRIHASATELAACFHPEWLAKNPFTVVPDGTQHGAKDNGDGTFTNPVVATPVVIDTSFAAAEFAAAISRKAAALADNGQPDAANYLLRKHGL